MNTDTREVRDFVSTYVAQARAATADIKQPGILNMVLVNPADDDVTSIYRFAIDDPNLVENMIADAINASEAGHNVYVEGRTVRPGLNGKQRGDLNDTVAVFALTVDSDSDKGAAWTPIVPISLAVETSPNNAHYWFFFDKALAPATAKALGDRLRAATKADSDTGNICQPYRLAGTVNYPNKKKRDRGRVVSPTRTLWSDEVDELPVWTPERLEQEFPITNGGGGGGGGTGTFDDSAIPADTMKVIRDGVEDGVRSTAFWNVIKTLKGDGWTVTGIVTLLERFPNGIANKYRGRLQREVERVWAKLDDRPPPPQPKRLTWKHFSAVTLPALSNYAIKGIFPKTGLAVCWGPPKSGKSFWTFDAVMHIATGKTYRGRNVRQGTVCYLALEGGSGFASRIEAWRRHHNPPKDVPFYLLDVPIDLVADHAALIAAIREQVPGDIAVIVIDTLNRAMFGNENDSKDMGQFIRAADAVRAAFNCLMIIVHHCGVAGSRPRGHTSLAGADDAQIMVERDKDKNVIAKVEFMKDAEGGAVIASKLQKIDLGTDAEGEPLSSCVAVPADSTAAGVKLTKTQRFAFDLLQKLITTEGVTAPADAHLLADFKVCRAETWRERFYQEYPGDKLNTKQKALLRATLDLEEQKLIVLWREFVWIKAQEDKTD